TSLGAVPAVALERARRDDRDRPLARDRRAAQAVHGAVVLAEDDAARDRGRERARIRPRDASGGGRRLRGPAVTAAKSGGGRHRRALARDHLPRPRDRVRRRGLGQAVARGVTLGAAAEDERQTWTYPAS